MAEPRSTVKVAARALTGMPLMVEAAAALLAREVAEVTPEEACEATLPAPEVPWEATLDAPEATLVATLAAPEVAVLKAPPAPEVTVVKAPPAPEVTVEKAPAAPEVASPKTEVAPEAMVWPTPPSALVTSLRTVHGRSVRIQVSLSAAMPSREEAGNLHCAWVPAMRTVSRRAWKAMMDLLNCMLNGCLFGR